MRLAMLILYFIPPFSILFQMPSKGWRLDAIGVWILERQRATHTKLSNHSGFSVHGLPSLHDYEVRSKRRHCASKPRVLENRKQIPHALCIFFFLVHVVCNFDFQSAAEQRKSTLSSPISISKQEEGDTHTHNSCCFRLFDTMSSSSSYFPSARPPQNNHPFSLVLFLNKQDERHTHRP
jgi:hypothetical protein